MPLDPSRVAGAVAQGLSFVCAACEHYWESMDAHAPNCGNPCGSPIAGDVFHSYKGPLTQFDQFCFVCGQEPTHMIRVGRLVRVVACCTAHVDLVKKLQAENLRPISVVIRSKDGEVASDDPAKPERVRLTLSG